MIWLLTITGYAALAALATWLLRRLRPTWNTQRIVATAVLPGPLVVLGAAAVAIARLGPAPPGEIDATGMAMMVYMVGGSVVAGLMGVLGLVASLVALRLPR